MQTEETIVREVLEMWADGQETTKESWRKHAADNLVWWNNARGQLDGLQACLDGIDAIMDALGAAYIKVPIRRILADDGIVMVERSDDLYNKDGTLIQAVPVTGVVEFEGDKIVSWRDYADDWMLKMSQERGANG